MVFFKELSHLNNNKAKVCIIGSGAAGLSAISVFKDHLDKFELEVFEKSGTVGGTWVYTEETNKDKFGLPIHSSMYKNLRTNIPLCIMEYPDFKAEKKREYFVTHEEVLEYLESYAKHINAYNFINFFHLVKQVKKEESSWKVEIVNLNNNELTTSYYDVVIVCNGRYSKPKIPDNVNLNRYKGKILHSHNYRLPEKFKDETVIIYGAGPSGLDISLELSNQCKKVYLLHELKKNFLDLPNNVEQVNNSIKYGVDKKIILTKNNQVLNDIDTVIFATGYDFDYDFLDENVGIKLTENNKLSNVYLHLLNSLHPTMCLLAIPQRIIPFPFYFMQITWFLNILLGKTELPSKEFMDKYEEEEYEERLKNGFKSRHSHKMVSEKHLWDYEKIICQQSNTPQMSNAKRNAFDSLHQLRTIKAANYKKTKYFIINENEYSIKE